MLKRCVSGKGMFALASCGTCVCSRLVTDTGLWQVEVEVLERTLE